MSKYYSTLHKLDSETPFKPVGTILAIFKCVLGFWQPDIQTHFGSSYPKIGNQLSYM